MNTKSNVLSIVAALAIGVFSIGALIVAGNTAKSTPAYSESDSPVQVVSMPPSPVAPTDQAAVKKATTIANSPSKDTSIATAPICSGAESQNFSCYEDYYANLLKTKGIPAAFADLKARYANTPYVQSQCHPLTHVLGRVAAEQFTKVSEAYAHGDSFCWSGYYHGVLETFAGRIGLKNLNAQINSICSDMNTDGKYSFDYFNCVHGIGHGLMAITDDQLFKSLDYCTSLKGDWEQQSCAGGVYMENVIADGLNHVTNYLDPKRPLYPCSDSPDKYKNTCYLMQTSYMLKVNGGDFAKTFQWCRDASPYIDTCDQSLGRDASGRSVSNAEKTKETCMLGRDTKEISNCAIGAVKDFISYFHSDTQGKALCNLFDDPVKATCLDTARSYYTSF